MAGDDEPVEIEIKTAGPSKQLRPVLSAVLALIIVAAGAMIGVRQLGDAEQAGGAATPEEAVQAMVASLEASDFLGVAEIIDPVERRNFSDPAFDVISEMQRLGLVAEEFDLGSIAGLSLSFVDTTYTSQPFGSDMNRVSMSGTWLMNGDYTAVPYGPLLTDRADTEELADTLDLREITDALVGSHSWADVDVEFDDLGVVTVQRDGKWFVSLAYSAAEAKRKDEGYRELPAIGGGPTPVGGATPEEAVANLANAIAARDARQILTSFDPSEAAVAYDYFNLFGDWAQDEINRHMGEPRSISIDRIELTSVVDADDTDSASVSIDDLAVTLEDSYSSFLFDLEADCPVLRSFGPAGGICIIDQTEVQSFNDETGIAVGGLLNQVTLRTQRVGERWFVAVVPSIVEPLFDLSSRTERSEVAAWIDDPDGLVVPASTSPEALIAKDGMAAAALSTGYLLLADHPIDLIDEIEERWDSSYEIDGSGSVIPEPTRPAEPALPAEPATPTEPVSPVEPATPSEPDEGEVPESPDEQPAFVLPDGVGENGTPTTTTVPPTTVPPTTVPPTTVPPTTTTTTTAAPEVFEAVTLTEFASFGTPASELKAEIVRIAPVDDVELVSSAQAAVLVERGWVLTIDMFPGELLQTRFFCDPTTEGCPAQGP